MLKSGLGVLLFPFLRYFGPRFGNVHLRLDKVDHHLVEIQESFDSLKNRLTEFEERVLADVQCTVELFTLQQRATQRLEQRLAGAERLFAPDTSEPEGNGTPAEAVRQQH